MRWDGMDSFFSNQDLVVLYFDRTWNDEKRSYSLLRNGIELDVIREFTWNIINN